MATVKVSQDTERARRGLPPKSIQRVRYDEKGRLAGDKPSARQHKPEISHANRKASVTPIARNSPSGSRARAAAGIRGFGSPNESKRKGPRLGNLGKFAFNPKAPTGYQHTLMAEMVVAFAIIGIRAIADYSPSSDMHSAGTETPKKGSSPITLIAATLAVYFVLAFMASQGGWPARVASAFGLLMIVALMINSQAELANVANWIENIGSNAANQAAPNTTNPQLPTSGSGSSGGLTPVPSTGPGSAGQPLS